MRLGLFCLCGPTLFLLCTQPTFGDWPGFLGGTSRETQPTQPGSIPLTWGVNNGVAWKTRLVGHGQSSPVVVDGSIYLTSIDGPNKETNLVHCVDLQSGEIRWSHTLPSSLLVKNDPYTSRAAPTPAADENGVIAFFESGDIVALTPGGEIRWERKLLDDYGKYEGRFGLGGSLAQTEERVFVLADNEGPAYLLALDKASGKTIWKRDRASRTAWSSPMLVDVAGEFQLVVSSAGTVDGYDPQTGELLWSLSDIGGNTVASPLGFGDGRFLVGASPGRNGENSEGAKRSNMAVRITKQDGKYMPEVLWRNTKATSSFGSPIVHQGRAYYVNSSGVLYCLDAQTGETLYSERMKESTWATPLGIGDRIYFFGRGGLTTVIDTGDAYRELATNQLWTPPADGGGPGGFDGEIQYGVALTERGLLIRTGENLYRIASVD